MRKACKQLLLISVACLSLSSAGLVFADQDNQPGQENAGQYIDNSALTLKVKAKLMTDDAVKSLPITVTSYKGIVQLSGFVDDKQQVKEAIRVAKSVDGVKEVKNALIIKNA